MTFKNLVSIIGNPFALRLTAHAPRILMYHRFAVQDEWRRFPIAAFEAQLQYLQRHFTVIRLTELAELLRDGQPPPRNAAVITVDDGYVDFHRLAAPLLVRYGMPATVFVVADFADQRIWLWYDALHYLITRTPVSAGKITFAGKQFKFRLHDDRDRNQLWGRLADHVLYAPQASKLRLIQACQDQLRIELPATPTDNYRSMNWQEINSLDPLIDIGSHTCSHPILSGVNDPDVLAHEIGASRQQIEQHIGRPVTTFCYPNGQARDYNATTLHEVERSGYVCAVSAHGGLVDPAVSNLFHLPRVPGPNTRDQFVRTISGLTHLRQKLPDKWT
ncbi:MAG: polysaccharide deacetylase family protein [Pseudomonadota bacterium]